MNDIRQFKLVDGSEIVCDVLEWNSDDTEEVVIRNALVIQYMMKDDYRMCSMRPWMLQQVQHNMIQILNAGHITVDAHPARETLDNYMETVRYLQLDLEETVKEEVETTLSVVTDEEKDNIISFLKNRKDKLH
tara:strand:+ start:242 stop:640 length:399 start_codon:yes stop_codon:yes gene_type:complete